MEPANQRAFAERAEFLVVHQLDLLAHLEKQIRAVHNILKHIEKLRDPKHRVGPELTNGQRADVLSTLKSALEAIDSETRVQHESCADMQRCIEEMRRHLGELRPIEPSAGKPTSTRRRAEK